ncbi:MAG: tail fiber domain-containing protein, partial [Candidatus Helarchaeota archaeon]
GVGQPLYWLKNIGGALYFSSTNPAGDRMVIGQDGNVGIGTTTPTYTLDVNGSIRATKSLTAGINVETLSTDKTLTPGIDEMYQYLDPNGTNRVITLDTSNALAGDRFIIRHNGVYNDTHYLQVKQGAATLDYIYAGAIKEFIFDGTNWISAENGAGENDNKKNSVAIGYYAIGYDFGTAVGRSAYGYNYGTAVGYGTYGYNYGTAVGFCASGALYGAAVGYQAHGFSYGAAVGRSAQGDNYGAAVGNSADGASYGAAVGYQAKGSSYGTAVGNSAQGNYYGTAVGYQANGYFFGTAVGRSAQGDHYGTAVGREAKGMRYGAALGYMAGRNINTTEDCYNTLVGAYSGYQITTGKGNIILGYKSGYDSTYSPTTGSYNILIGYQSWTPAHDTSNFLNIGGLIFGTNLATTPNTISTGGVGIGTTDPGNHRLYVNGTAYSTGGWQSSDERLKNVISGIESPVERLEKLKGVKFVWKTDEYPEKGLPEGAHYGLIAQEVEKVFPEMVGEDNEGYKTLSYNELIPVLIEAIKEQEKTIKEQEKRIEVLETKLNIRQ